MTNKQFVWHVRMMRVAQASFLQCREDSMRAALLKEARRLERLVDAELGRRCSCEKGK